MTTQTQIKNPQIKNLSPKQIAELVVSEFGNPFDYKNFDPNLADIAIKKAIDILKYDEPAEICYPSIHDFRRQSVNPEKYHSEFCVDVAVDVMHFASDIYRQLYYKKIASQIRKALSLLKNILGESQ